MEEKVLDAGLLRTPGALYIKQYNIIYNISAKSCFDPKRLRWVLRRLWYFHNKYRLTVGVISATVGDELAERNIVVHKRAPPPPICFNTEWFEVDAIKLVYSRTANNRYAFGVN